MNTAIVDDDVAIKLDGRAIVTRRVERVLAIAIGAKPTAPFDAELLLRERRRIRRHEVEVDLSLHSHKSRLVAPVRVGVERRCNAPLRPHPQDWHEEYRDADLRQNSSASIFTPVPATMCVARNRSARLVHLAKAVPAVRDLEPSVGTDIDTEPMTVALDGRFSVRDHVLGGVVRGVAC